MFAIIERERLIGPLTDLKESSTTIASDINDLSVASPHGGYSEPHARDLGFATDPNAIRGTATAHSNTSLQNSVKTNNRLTGIVSDSVLGLICALWCTSDNQSGEYGLQASRHLVRAEVLRITRMCLTADRLP